jgi:hypothetical protein
MSFGPDQPPEKRFRHAIGPQVHSILWRDWDPIGVNGAAPDDEYDAYVWPVIGKIMRGETVDQLADYLDWVVGERMGLTVVRDASVDVARKLLQLRPSEA